MPFSPTKESLNPGERWTNSIWMTLISDLASYLGAIPPTDVAAPIKLTRPGQSIGGGQNSIYRFKRLFHHADGAGDPQADYMVYDVTGYGAKGDGINDDSAGIQAAIDDFPAGSGGLVIIPPGTYIIEDEIDLAGSGNTRTGITLMGFGDATVLKLKDSTIINSIINMGDASNPSRQVVANLKIDGNKDNQGGGIQTGIDFDTATESLAYNVTIVDCNGHGIKLGDGSGSNNSIIGCRVIDPDQNGIVGRVEEPYFITNLLIRNCIISGAGQNGIVGRGWRGCSIENNQILSINQVGIILDSKGMKASVKAMKIVGNTIKDIPNGTGIFLRHVP